MYSFVTQFVSCAAAAVYKLPVPSIPGTSGSTCSPINLIKMFQLWFVSYMIKTMSDPDDLVLGSELPLLATEVNGWLQRMRSTAVSG